jgi:hypothetical protein
VEGPRRNIPYSITKVKTRAKLLYWKARVGILKRKKIDVTVIVKRKEEAELSNEETENKDPINEYILA